MFGVLGLRIEGLGFGVWGSGFRVNRLRGGTPPIVEGQMRSWKNDSVFLKLAPLALGFGSTDITLSNSRSSLQFLAVESLGAERLRVSGLTFQPRGLGSRVWGLGCRV